MKKRRINKPKFKSLLDLVPESPSKGKDGCLKPGAPIDLYMERYAHDRALHAEHTLKCCGCGFTHLYTFEVYTDQPPKGENAGQPRWWMKIRAYGDENTRPKRVIDAEGKAKK